MPSLGRLVKQLRTDRDLTQKDLGERVGVSRDYIASIESNRVELPGKEIIHGLARALQIPAEELLIAAGYLPSAPSQPAPTPPRRTTAEILRELEEVTPIMVPETLQPASAGPGTFADAEAWPYMPEAGERRHRFVATRVTGDCMQPEIPEGAHVIVDKDASPQPGDIVLAIHDGETIIKRLEQRNGDLYLVARQGRPSIKVEGDTAIIGVVVQWGMRAKRRR